MSADTDLPPTLPPMFPYGRRNLAPVPPGEPALVAGDVWVRHPGAFEWALQGASLAIAAGERVALCGSNGAGKSTLLQVMAGLLRPQGGKVTVLGLHPKRARHHIAYVPQENAVAWDFPMNVLEFVTTGRYLFLGWLRWPKDPEKNRARRALAQMNIEDLAQRPIAELSGGQRQRVLLARALTQEAQLYLLDEPTSAADAVSRAAILGALDALSAAGHTVVVATHDPLFPGRRIELKGGTVVGTNTPALAD